MVKEAMCERGYDVKMLSSDFSHISKRKREDSKDFILLKTKVYKKNLSFSRIFSHITFARDAFSFVEKEAPDLLWLMVPANSLIRQASIYKKKHPETRLIIDVIDMWPESLPVQFNKNLFPFRIWKTIRSRYLNCADQIVSECDLYQETLKKETNKPIKTIYWSRENKAFKHELFLSEDKLVLCYVGSINNIIDIDRIVTIVKNISIPIVFHIIGEGENTDRLTDGLRPYCKVIYHGPVRDEKEKRKIFDKCHAGINIYKDGLYIGLTVKCLDYFENGLPIINDIKGDTWKLIEGYKAGINVLEGTVIDHKKLFLMRKHNDNIIQLYNSNFTKEIFKSRCNEVLNEDRS